MERQRKPFSGNDYQNAKKAFQFLKRDFEAAEIFGWHRYYPVLLPEDYDIDVAVYLDQRAYEEKEDPIFFIELEIKTETCCKWTPGHYPFPDIHFLYRKAHLTFQNKVPFWVMYNEAGTDCCIVNMEAIASYPIAQNSSKTEDLIYLLPPQLCQFGTQNLIQYIEEYYGGQIDVSLEYVWGNQEEVFQTVNVAYAARHKYQIMKQEHQKLVRAQQRNLTHIGIKHYL